MSGSNEEENGISRSSIDESAVDRSNVYAAAAAAAADCSDNQASQQHRPPADDLLAAQPREQRAFRSPYRRRRTVRNGSERAGCEASSVESSGAVSGDHLDMGALGPPQSSSSPVKRTPDRRTGSWRRAGGGASREHGSGAEPDREAAPQWPDCRLASVSRALDSPTTAGEFQLHGEHEYLFPLLPGMEEDMKRKPVSHVCLADKCKLLDEEFASIPTTADPQMTRGKVTLSVVDEVSGTVSPTNDTACSSSSSETEGNPQVSHFRKDTEPRSGSKLSHTRKVKPDTPRPVFVDKRTRSTVQRLQDETSFDEPQGSRAGMKSKHVQSKLELGTQEASEKAKARACDRNGLHIPQHRSRRTSALPLTDVTAHIHNVKPSQAQNTRGGTSLEDKLLEVYYDKVAAGQCLLFRQRQFKIPTVQTRARPQSTETKGQERRTKLLTYQEQLEEDTNSNLHLTQSASRLPVAKGSNMSDRLQFQPSGNHKQMVRNLPKYCTFDDFITSRQDSIRQNSFANGRQRTGIPNPLKSLQLNSNRAIPDSTRSRMPPLQISSPPVLITVEQRQQLSDANLRRQLPGTRTERQEPLIQRTVPSADDLAGIVLSDEVPTRDKEVPRVSIDGTRVVLSGCLGDYTQRLQTVSAEQSFQFEATTCRLHEFAKKNSGTAEVGTQTVLSVSASPASVPTASTVSPARNSERRHTGALAPASATPTNLRIPDRRAVNCMPRGLYPISHRLPVPLYPQPIVWPHTYEFPISYQIPPRYMPLYPRYPEIPGLLNTPWICNGAFEGGDASFPYSAFAPPLPFPAPRVYYAPPTEPTWVRPPVVYYAPPTEPTWVRPPVVYYAPPADVLCQPVPRTLHHFRPERRPNRQAVNERVAAWLREVDAAGGARSRSSSSSAPSTVSRQQVASGSSAASGTSPLQ